MSWTVVAHTAASTGHHGTATTETFHTRADAERYAREARDEGAITNVTGQHEEKPVTLERARQWMNHIAGMWARARTSPTDHQHHNGVEHCLICSTPTVEWRCGNHDCTICGD